MRRGITAASHLLLRMPTTPTDASTAVEARRLSFLPGKTCYGCWPQAASVSVLLLRGKASPTVAQLALGDFWRANSRYFRHHASVSCSPSG